MYSIETIAFRLMTQKPDDSQAHIHTHTRTLYFTYTPFPISITINKKNLLKAIRTIY